jgi:acetyl-CoA acyltransferase
MVNRAVGRRILQHHAEDFFVWLKGLMIADDHFDADPSVPDRTYGRRGGFLDPIDFDAMHFGVPPSVVPSTDTAQLLALIVAQRVLDDAMRGQFSELDRTRASVILGVTSGQELFGAMASRMNRPMWLQGMRRAGIAEDVALEACDRILALHPEWTESTFPGLLGNVVAGRIANRLDLGGTNCVTDAACASSFSAISMGVNELYLGDSDLVIAGGVENMTRVERANDVSEIPALVERYDVESFRMGNTAEAVAERFDVSREAQDEYAARSQQRAVAATRTGRFDDEIVPIDTDEGTVTEDEGLRPGTTVEKLAELPTVFAEDGTVTPGNASQISDGAAAVMVTSRAFAEDHGLDVLGAVGAHEVVGVDPELMGIGPVPAVRGLLDRKGTSIDDYGLVELNEAFASQTLYCQRELGVDDDRFNVNGGAIAIGHPLGASGARLPVTLLHEMNRRGVDRGLATECVGYGQGAAIEFLAD